MLDTSERVLLEYARVGVVFMVCELELRSMLIMGSWELTLSKRLSSFRGNYKAFSPRKLPSQKVELQQSPSYTAFASRPQGHQFDSIYALK